MKKVNCDQRNVETRKTVNFTRKSYYNPKRRSFVTEDGKLAYIFWDPEANKETTFYYEIGKDGITEELAILIDEDDHRQDLQERYDREKADYDFQNKQRHHDEDEQEFAQNPVESLLANGADPQEILFPEDETPNELLFLLMEAMDKLTDAQKNLVFDRYGAMKQLEEIRQEEIAETGREVSQQAVSNRWKKIIARLCKELGVEVPKKRKEDPE